MRLGMYSSAFGNANWATGYASGAFGYDSEASGDYASAFSFIYSPRPGTPAAEMEQVPHDVVQDRFERLVALQERITEENLKTFEGRDVEVMVTGASGKKDAATHRVTGREKTGVLVHVGVPEGEPMPQVGDFVTATITHAGRHNLIADPDPKAGQTYAVRH